MFPVIRNPQGERLDYTFHSGATDDSAIVVIGHGVTGHKDRPFLVALAESLSRAGLATLRLSFAGNGQSEGRFVDSNITKNAADLGAVLDVLPPGRRIIYAGHSMGGAVGLFRASQDRRIHALISLAAIVHAQAFAQRTFGHLSPGDLMFDRPGCVLSQAYRDDLTRIGSLVTQAAAINVPWLFVHGARDTLVPLGDTHDAFARAREPKRLVVLDHADHIFEPGCTGEMTEAVTAWCLEQAKH